MYEDRSKMFPEFETFLLSMGLTCRLQTEADEVSFGNRLIEYRNESVGVRIILDRGQWTVVLADIATRPGKWYDLPRLKLLICGHGEDVIPLYEKMEFIQKNWQEIVDAFGSARQAYTHERLRVLGEERAARLWPPPKK
jgi:hypothetical protein